MPPTRDEQQAARDAGIALLLHTLCSQLIALTDRADRIARAIEQSTTAIEVNSRASNPWAVLSAGLVIVGRVVERLPPWGLVGLLAIPVVGITVAGAPTAAPLLATLIGVVSPAVRVAP